MADLDPPQEPILENDRAMGPFRIFAPIIIGWLVNLGLDSVTAGYVSAAILAIVMAGWSFMSNRQAQQARNVARAPGVEVLIKPNAPESLRELANDPTAPNVKKVI